MFFKKKPQKELMKVKRLMRVVNFNALEKIIMDCGDGVLEYTDENEFIMCEGDNWVLAYELRYDTTTDKFTLYIKGW